MGLGAKFRILLLPGDDRFQEKGVTGCGLMVQSGGRDVDLYLLCVFSWTGYRLQLVLVLGVLVAVLELSLVSDFGRFLFYLFIQVKGRRSGEFSVENEFLWRFWRVRTALIRLFIRLLLLPNLNIPKQLILNLQSIFLRFLTLVLPFQLLQLPQINPTLLVLISWWLFLIELV